MSSHQQKTTKKPFKLRELFQMRSAAWLLAWSIGIITLIATVGLLATSGWFISAAAIAGIITGGAALSFDFFRPAAMIRTFAIARTAGRYGERIASHHAVLALLKDLRCRFFSVISQQKLQHTSALVQSDQMMHRLISDIEQLDELPLRYWAPWIWAQSLTAIFLLFVWIYAPSIVFIITLLLLSASLVIPIIGSFLGRRLAYEITVLSEQRRQKLLQPLNALTSLLLWQQWNTFSQQFMQIDAQFALLQRKQQRIANILVSLQQSILALVILVLIYKGFPLIATATLSIPMLLAFILAVFGLTEVIIPLSAGFTALGFAVASRDRLNQLMTMDANHEMTQSLPALPLTNIQLKVRDLTVKHSSAIQGINDISFSLKSGDILLIDGVSGGGKSTLLNALADELEPQKGDILINDRPLNKWNLSINFGYLAQQIDIFDLSLADNLRLGKATASEEELWGVLDIVDLATWTHNQPDGLNTILGEYGAAISGGQARRIALARLLLTPKSILILDEPFAGLDAKTISRLTKRLTSQLENGILIIVSHQTANIDHVKKLTI